MMKTLEQLAGWLAFALSILMVYGFLAMFLIGPTHARGTIPGPDPYGWIDIVFNTKEQPTFAQIVWRGPRCGAVCVDVKNEDDGVSLGIWCSGDPEPQE